MPRLGVNTANTFSFPATGAYRFLGEDNYFKRIGGNIPGFTGVGGLGDDLTDASYQYDNSYVIWGNPAATALQQSMPGVTLSPYTGVPLTANTALPNPSSSLSSNPLAWITNNPGTALIIGVGLYLVAAMGSHR